MIPAVTTTEIYKGSIAFIVLQLIMVAAIMLFPNLVTGGIEKVEKLSTDQVMEQLQMPKPEEEEKPAESQVKTGEEKPEENVKTKEDDPMKAILEANEKDQKK
jgi:uncharacterized membrane protein